MYNNVDMLTSDFRQFELTTFRVLGERGNHDDIFFIDMMCLMGLIDLMGGREGVHLPRCITFL